MNDRYWSIAEEVHKTESEALDQALRRMDPAAFARAVEALAAAGRIAASACGHSGIACQHFAHLCCCIGLPARFISPAEAVHGAMGFVQPGDVMLLASRGGKTSELLPILRICQQRGVVVIVVTENAQSQLAEGADIVLRIQVTREVDPHNAQGTTSFTVMSVLFDALQCALMDRIQFNNGQFALVHPGGAVGERLNP